MIRPGLVPLTSDQRICRCAHRLIQHSSTIRLPLWGVEPQQGLLLVSRVDSALEKTVVFRFAHGRVLLATVKGDKTFKVAKNDTAWAQMMLALSGEWVYVCQSPPCQQNDLIVYHV